MEQVRGFNKTRRQYHRQASWDFERTEKCWRCKKHFTVYENTAQAGVEAYKCPHCGVYNIE